MRAAAAGFALVLGWILATPTLAAEYRLMLPRGLEPITAQIPADNPLTAEKIALGKQLFWDARLSTDGSLACVSCHRPEHGWSDPRPLSVHIGGRVLPRRSPTLINRLFSERQGWAGVFESLEDFVRRSGDGRMVFQQLPRIPAYLDAFRQLFGAEVTPEALGKVVASYMRTIVSGSAPYDRFRAGDAGALSPAARRGLTLFEGKARCARCHDGANFTDEGYHNLGVGMDRENPDLGRFRVTQREVNRGAFKTPTLRDVARRPPYMHDGSLKTLGEVVAFYNRGGIANPWRSPEIMSLDLAADEQADLVAFLDALTGEVAPAVATPPILPP